MVEGWFAYGWLTEHRVEVYRFQFKEIFVERRAGMWSPEIVMSHSSATLYL